MSTRHQASSPAFARDAVLDPTLHKGFAGQPGNGKALMRSVVELAASGDGKGRSVCEGQEKAVIRTPDRRLRVFVSSSLDELADERRAVARAISALRHTPVMFEQGARPHPAPPDVYRAYLARSEVFIGLYWQQYGQAPPGADISGLEEEFDLPGSLPKLLYVKEPAPGRDPRLARLLDRIRQQGAVSYRTFSGPAELGQLVRDDLAEAAAPRPPSSPG
jgi:Domain of unknown function (DUF4062)